MEGRIGVTDHFEKAKDRILKEARANGGVTTDHLLDALIATNEDLDEKLEEQVKVAKAKHNETRTWHEGVTALVEEHIEEAAIRDERIEALERVSMTCDERVQNYVSNSHKAYHEAYVAGLKRSRGKVVWLIGGKLGYILIAVLITLISVAINYWWFGTP